MEIIRDYQELLEMATPSIPSRIEEVVKRLVTKGVIRPAVAQQFLMEIR